MTPSSASIRLLVLTASCLFPACVPLRMVKPEDVEVGRARLRELEERSGQIYADARDGQLSPADSEDYLRHSLTVVQALETRHRQMTRHPDEVTPLNDLETNLHRLLARGQPLRPDDGLALHNQFAYVRQRDLFNGWVNASSSAGTGSAGDTTTDSACPPPKEKDKHHDHHHGHRDHDDHAKKKDDDRDDQQDDDHHH